MHEWASVNGKERKNDEVIVVEKTHDFHYEFNRTVSMAITCKYSIKLLPLGMKTMFGEIRVLPLHTTV